MVQLGQADWSEGVEQTQVAHIISQTVGMDVDIPGTTSTFRSKVRSSLMKHFTHAEPALAYLVNQCTNATGSFWRD